METAGSNIKELPIFVSRSMFIKLIENVGCESISRMADMVNYFNLSQLEVHVNESNLVDCSPSVLNRVHRRINPFKDVEPNTLRDYAAERIKSEHDHKAVLSILKYLKCCEKCTFSRQHRTRDTFISSRQRRRTQLP